MQGRIVQMTIIGSATSATKGFGGVCVNEPIRKVHKVVVYIADGRPYTPDSIVNLVAHAIDKLPKLECIQVDYIDNVDFDTVYTQVLDDLGLEAKS